MNLERKYNTIIDYKISNFGHETSSDARGMNNKLLTIYKSKVIHIFGIIARFQQVCTCFQDIHS